MVTFQGGVFDFHIYNLSLTQFKLEGVFEATLCLCRFQAVFFHTSSFDCVFGTILAPAIVNDSQ